MTIVREKDQLIITIPTDVLDVQDIQPFLDYIRYRELVKVSTATADDEVRIIDEINDSLATRNALFSRA